MSRTPSSLSRLFTEPPPELAYEISESGIAMVRTASPTQVSFHSFEPGVIKASPLHDNVLSPDELLAGVRAVTPPATGRKRRQAALLLPDAAARVSVLDFEKLPEKTEELDALVRFRLKKIVPFDVETAAMSYWRQPGLDGKRSVVAAVAPLEIVARYEAPFRAQNIHPGFLTLSFLAAMELAPVSATITFPHSIGAAARRDPVDSRH
jgi:type IV pilus assembly protein PilM